MANLALQSYRWGGVNILRQTTGYSGLVPGARWIVPDTWSRNIDFLIICDPNIHAVTEVTSSLRVLLHMENANIWIPSVEDMAGCSVVISPFDLSSLVPRGVKFIMSYPCVPWFYGVQFCVNSGLLHRPLETRLELQAMSNLLYPQKRKLLSMIVSSKSHTPGHAWRQQLASAAKSYFGSLIDVYGFGHLPIPDKRDAIDPYVYSIVIENEDADFYVTEKVVDCLIGWTIPIYSGTRRLDDLFTLQIPRIPFGCSIENALKIISAIISSGGISIGTLERIRATAMKRLNLFEELPRILGNL